MTSYLWSLWWVSVSNPFPKQARHTQTVTGLQSSHAMKGFTISEAQPRHFGMLHTKILICLYKINCKISKHTVQVRSSKIKSEFCYIKYHRFMNGKFPGQDQHSMNVIDSFFIRPLVVAVNFFLHMQCFYQYLTVLTL